MLFQNSVGYRLLERNKIWHDIFGQTYRVLLDEYNGIYDNKLLYVRHYGDCAPEFTAIEYLNLKNNRRVILKRNQQRFYIML